MDKEQNPLNAHPNKEVEEYLKNLPALIADTRKQYEAKLEPFIKKEMVIAEYEAYSKAIHRGESIEDADKAGVVAKTEIKELADRIIEEKLAFTRDVLDYFTTCVKASHAMSEAILADRMKK